MTDVSKGDQSKDGQGKGDQNKDSAVNYHHGNLRLALLDATVAQIKEVGVEKLSLRGIARIAGVSQTAPYRHFKDKNELLAEVATQAFIDLYQATSQQLTPQRTTCENIEATALAYVDFAIANPERYKLMFGPSIQNRRSYSNMLAAGERSFNVLISQVEHGIEEGIFLNDCAMILANTLWTQVHGIASLIIDGFYQNRELPMPFDEFLRIQISIASRAIQINPTAYTASKITSKTDQQVRFD